MINGGTKNILGVGISAVDYEAAVEAITQAAKDGQAFSVSALAVHGLMTGHLDREHRYRLNSFDLCVPDGQPVRWALNLLYKAGLKDRVYGPNLTLYLCQRAAQEGLPVYFYGSQESVLENLTQRLQERFPPLQIAGSSPSLFRPCTPQEKVGIAQTIRDSGARMVFVGLGCPRQEIFAYEFRELLPMPAIAVGAAFDFHAGSLAQAPKVLQDWGLEWAFRLVKEPGRLWKRYLKLNPLYLALIALQFLVGSERFQDSGLPPAEDCNYA